MHSQRIADNTPRFRRGTDCVESWFIRCNDPRSPRAIWVKATVLCRSDGPAVAEAWVSIFDGERTHAERSTVALTAESVVLAPEGVKARVAGTAVELGESSGTTTGELGPVRWDLAFTAAAGSIGQPVCPLPTRRLVDAGVPRNKVMSPFPAAAFTGVIEWAGERIDVADWWGMQGHNWGAAHAPEYAWGQCLFTEGPALVGMVEGASGRIELGSTTSPLLSFLIVRHRGREYRFDRLVDLWRQQPGLDFPEWRLRMRGAAGVAEVRMRAEPRRMVCLGYDNPSGERRFCLNSKTAGVELRMRPVDDPPFRMVSEHGGALEFLQAVEEPLVQPVV